MGTREGLRIIATLIGGGFLVYAVMAVLRGTLYDVDDGRVNRADRPVTFWLLVLGMSARVNDPERRLALSELRFRLRIVRRGITGLSRDMAYLQA